MALSSREYFINQVRLMDLKREAVRRASGHISMLMDIRDSVGATVQGVESAPNWHHLNDAGRKSARQNALADHFRNIERARLDLARQQRKVEASMPSLPPLDRTDVVGAMLDQEARALVRSMPQEKRDAIMRAELSPEIAAAVARAAPELSGVSPGVHAMLRQKMLETAYPQELAALKEDGDALRLAEEALRLTAEAAKEAGGFAHDTEFKTYTQRVLEPVAAEEAKAVEAEKKDDEDMSLEALFQRARSADVSKRIKLVDRLMEVNTTDVYGSAAA
jgi:hypothetical protein